MPKFAANLSFMFSDIPFLDRFAAAADCGFKAVEYLFPYDFEPDVLKAKLDAAGLEQALFNLSPGNWDAGERGLAAMPGREIEFDAAVTRALDYADALGNRLIHAMPGLRHHGANHATYVSNLKRGSAMAADRGRTLIIEPINQRDIPGFFLSTTAQARGVIAEVGSENLALQFDLYHRQIEEGDVARAIGEFGHLAAHYQVANPPDRAEPDHGEMNYAYLFDVLDATGYDGWVGCEYKPRGDTRALQRPQEQE
ncbi:MAG: 2-oxo-tetronate isomerase, partial [Pseudomonadota bacterium]